MKVRIPYVSVGNKKRTCPIFTDDDILLRMRAAVVVPPVRDFYHTPHRFSALGARTVASILSRAGWETEVFNFPQEHARGMKIPLPEELDHLDPFIIRDESGQVSWFTAYRHFGPSFDECAERIRDFSPEAVFISCFAYCYAEESVRLAEAVKKAVPKAHIAVGGPGVTVSPRYFSGCRSIDSVLPGEAETVLPEFLGGREIPAPGTRFTDGDEIEPVFGITKETETSLSISVSVSRGCPGRCRFCSNHLTHGRRFRTASIDKVRAAVRRIPASKRTTINFEDDNLLASKDYFFALIDAFRSHIPADLRFLAENGIDYTLLDDDSLNVLMEAGLLQFNFTLGTTDFTIRKSENRIGDPGKLSALLETIGRSGIPSVTYFICGFEDDTRETVIENLLFLARLPTRTGISLFYPVPGLPGFPAENELLMRTPRRAAGSSAWPWTGSLTTGDLITAFRLARFSNLLREHKRNLFKPVPDDEVLIRKILSTGRLHTYIRDGAERILKEVPFMNERMVSAFMNGVRGDA